MHTSEQQAIIAYYTREETPARSLDLVAADIERLNWGFYVSNVSGGDYAPYEGSPLQAAVIPLDDGGETEWFDGNYGQPYMTGTGENPTAALNAAMVTTCQKARKLLVQEGDWLDPQPILIFDHPIIDDAPGHRAVPETGQ